MKILALDLATRTGWATYQRGGRVLSGSVSFAPRGSEGRGGRWNRFRAFLSDHQREGEIGAVYAEQPVQLGSHSGSTTLVLGGFLAMLEAWTETNRIPLHMVSIGTVKKHWTGRGDAKKPDMVRVARERGFRPTDDNEADALALLDFARNAEGEPTPTAIEQTVLVPLHRVTELSVAKDPFAP